MSGYVGSKRSSSLVSFDEGTIGSGVVFPTFVGMIASFAMSTPPSGWIKANGAAISSTTYSLLFTAIGSQWVTAWTNSESITTGDYRKNSSGVIYIATSTGTTSGTDVGDDVGVTWSASSNFLVPDLRGEFPRGWDDSRGVDSGRSFGSAQSDNFESHTHNVNSNGTSFISSTQSGTGSNNIYIFKGNNQYKVVNTNTTATGGDETRPRNIALLACIKY